MADEKKNTFQFRCSAGPSTNNHFEAAKVFVLVNFTCMIFGVKKLQNVTEKDVIFQIS